MNDPARLREHLGHYLVGSFGISEGPDLFGVGEGNARARFVRDDSGRVVAMETLIRFSPTQVATFRDERLGAPTET